MFSTIDDSYMNSGSPRILDCKSYVSRALRFRAKATLAKNEKVANILLTNIYFSTSTFISTALMSE